MERHLAWRKTVSPDTVLDVPYADVRDDDIGVMRRVYDFCGLAWSSEAEKPVRVPGRSRIGNTSTVCTGTRSRRPG